MGFMTQIQISIAQIGTKNLYDKNFKYIQLSTSLSLKFNIC